MLNNFESKVYNKLFIKKPISCSENKVSTTDETCSISVEEKYTKKEIVDIINLESIVEKEEKNSEEKSTVA
jgi:cell division protein YceG involved in septum cleavage